MIDTKNYKDKLKFTITLIFIFIGVYFVSFYSKIISTGIKEGLKLCTTTLVPSLFMFMILSDIIANSKAVHRFCHLFKKPFYKLTKLPSECIVVLLMSVIGGYPVGAKCTIALLKNTSITKSEAEKLSLMAVSSGFGFVVNFVAISIFNNRYIGYVLMISQLVAFLVNVVLCSVFIKTDDEINRFNSTKEKYTLIDSVSNGTKATINMCAMVILFSGILSVAKVFFSDSPFVYDLVCMILEVTNATKNICMRYPLWVTSFVLSFSGLCVHFQIFAILRDINVNKCLFFIFRIISGIISALSTYILLKISSETVAVFSTVDTTEIGNSTTVWGSIALMLTGISFLNSLKISKHIRR